MSAPILACSPAPRHPWVPQCAASPPAAASLLCSDGWSHCPLELGGHRPPA